MAATFNYEGGFLIATHTAYSCFEEVYLLFLPIHRKVLVTRQGIEILFLLKAEELLLELLLL